VSQHRARYCRGVRGCDLLQKLVLLTDATSPVTGFESLQDAYFSDMATRGLKTATTENFLA
jgi:hypothetical protein